MHDYRCVGGNGHDDSWKCILLTATSWQGVVHFNAKTKDQGSRKHGAKLAWKELDNSGLGAFIDKPAGRGTRDICTCMHAWHGTRR